MVASPARPGPSTQTDILHVIIIGLTPFHITSQQIGSDSPQYLESRQQRPNEMQIESLDLCQALSGARLASGPDLRRISLHQPSLRMISLTHAPSVPTSLFTILAPSIQYSAAAFLVLSPIRRRGFTF